MARCIACFLFGLACLVLWAAPGAGQDEKKKDAEKKVDQAVEKFRTEVLQKAEDEYRRRFKKPETPAQFWVAMNFELKVGQLSLAAEFLKGLLAAAKDPANDLLPIVDAEGLSAFLRLRNIRNWVEDPNVDPKVRDRINKEVRAEVETLITRVTEALTARAKDPVQIKKYITNLQADTQEPEVREYAIVQLRRGGAVVVPYMLEGMNQAESARDREAIRSAFLRLNRDIVPPLLAALDIKDDRLQVDVIDTLRQRAERQAVPYLWYLSASPREPEFVRKRATDALVYFLGIGQDQLPPAKVALTREADRYYRRAVNLGETDPVTVWQVQNNKFVMPPPTMSLGDAENYFGFKFARQALELDRTYEPAQVLFLSLALAKGYERTGLDKPPPADVRDLLKTVNPELVTAVLKRALAERRLPVILGAVQTLGDLAEVRAALPTRDGPPALIRALNYPDRRVQMAAADALLRIPPPPSELPRGRIVEILRRALAADTTPRALVAQPNPDRDAGWSQSLRQAGFEPVLVHTGRDALRRLTEAADIDVVLVDAGIALPELPDVLAQLRNDVQLGLLPVLVLAALPQDQTLPSERELRLRRLVGRYRNVWLMQPTLTPNVLKATLNQRIVEASGQPLTKEERSSFAALAMTWLKRMAVGEVAGYDFQRASDAFLEALRNDELALQAIAAAGRLPGRVPQRELAAVVLGKTRPAKIRAAAAEELVRHIQEHGLVLDKPQLAGLRELYRATDDPKLRPVVALLVGVLRPDASRTGSRLLEYAPPKPAAGAPAAPEAPPGEPEKEKP